MPRFLTGICMYKKCTNQDRLCKDRYCEVHCPDQHGADHSYPDGPVSDEAKQYHPMAATLVAVTEEICV